VPLGHNFRGATLDYKNLPAHTQLVPDRGCSCTVE